MTISSKIKGYRNFLGLTQEQLGEKLGISKQSYNNKENGKTAFTDSEKILIKNMLVEHFPKITLEDIFF